MKRKAHFLISLLLFSICIGCSYSDVEICCEVIEPTCISEGYTEHVFSSGYICRDNFKEKIPHQYISFEINGENSIVYQVCSFCGKLKEYNQKEVDINTEVIIDRDRERPSFINHDHMAVSMVIEKDPESAIKKIRLSEAHGAHGIMLYITGLEEKYRNIDDLERIMYCTNLPILVLAYGSEELLKLGVSAGACAVDMPGYMFGNYENTYINNRQFVDYYSSKGIDTSFVGCDAREISLEPEIVSRQRQFIDEIHNLGAEVLYSAHTQVEMSSEQIVAAAKFIETLGVDVAKIVCEGSSKETVIEHLKSIILLESELSIKFSVHGESTLSRLFGPLFGSYIAFCIDDKFGIGSTNLQIDLETMLEIINYFNISQYFQKD